MTPQIQNNAAQAAEKAIRAAITLLDGDLDHENAEAMRTLLSLVRAPVADELPHWEEISAKLERDETLTPLELFIHENEPAGGDADAWRDQLSGALASAPVAGEAVTWEEVRQELAIFLMGATGHSSKEWLRPLDNASEGGALAKMRACLTAPLACAEDVRKVRADAFIAGFICAGGDADEAKRQAPQFQACVDAGGKSQSQPDKAKPERLP